MNLIVKVLLATAFLSFSSQIKGQVELPSAPTPPTMEIPEVTPTTDELVVEAIDAERNAQSTPQITEEVMTETVSTPVATNAEPLLDEMPNELPANEVNIGLSSEVRQKIATILNKLLSDEYVLYTKTLKFHWNVVGIVFHDFHQAFKEQYEKIFNFVDDVAERARALGAPALGSLEDFSTYTRLKEIKADKLSPIQMVKQLLADHEAIIRTLRANIDETAALGDQGTSNFLQDLIVKHEKIAWMLRSTAAQ